MCYLSQIYNQILSLISLKPSNIVISLERCSIINTLTGDHCVEIAFSLPPDHDPNNLSQVLSYISGMDFLGLKLRTVLLSKEMILPDFPSRMMILTQWTTPSPSDNQPSSLPFYPHFTDIQCASPQGQDQIISRHPPCLQGFSTTQ